MKMTDDEFLYLLKLGESRLEEKRPCDKPLELEKNELNFFMSLKDTDSAEEACNLLRPLFEHYKGSRGKRSMPEMIVKGIYFIIYREFMWNEEKWLEDDGKLRRRVVSGCASKVYKLLGETSKVQERLGIQPLRDYGMHTYERVGIYAPRKDVVFREMILQVQYWADNAMFIDLTGEDTIFSDIYYCDREVICCRDSVTANFYYALQLCYKELCRQVKSTVKRLDGDMNDIIERYKRELENSKKVSMEELKPYERDKIEKLISSRNCPIVPTYPLDKKRIELGLAVKYLIVLLSKSSEGITTEELQERIGEMCQKEINWMRMRLKNVIISWSSVENILSKIDSWNVSFLHLQREKIVYRPDETKNERYYAYYENIEDKVKRGNNKDKRLKKGFLFFDFNVRKDAEEAWVFRRFVKKNDCQWAFCCESEDKEWIGMLKGKNVRIIETNYQMLYEDYPGLRSYRDHIVITNIEVRSIMCDELKRFFHTFTMDDKELEKFIIIRDSLDTSNENVDYNYEYEYDYEYEDEDEEELQY